MYIVKGFKKNSGVIKATGKKWENYSLFCLKESKDDSVTGYEVHTAKVSPSILQEVFPNSSAMIDSKININYGVRTFGGVEKLVVESIDIIK
ncbi:hypothetical protein [Ruminococcus sp.]|uniref:hypothetical protein n=1 Tax=Ruminococcus sp. TaxID=41978 RepID=UPI003FD7C908